MADGISTIAAVPRAVMVAVDGPRKRIRVVATCRCTVTRMMFTGSVAERLLVEIPTVAASGKSTLTVSDAVPKPLMLCAYWQGVAVSPVPQVKAVPAVCDP